MSQRLSKVLAACGIASRRASEELIVSGKVTVNGKRVDIPQTLVDPLVDQIHVEGRLIKTQDKVYYLLNKPKGYICSNAAVGNKKLVIDLFDSPHRLFTVGRLDRDTTGLLIVTNDGHFANRVIHPSANITKEYLVKTEEEIDEEHLKLLSKGTLIEKTWIKPFRVTKVRHGTLKITVKEGKKREVRLMVQNAGLTLTSLSRIRIGGLLLGPTPEGSYKLLSEKERLAIFQ